MSRTHINWDKHIVKEIKHEDVLIHILEEPGTSIHRIVYINAYGILSVTGDFGNWVFCREFHPSPNGEVSAGYWCEKLEIASTQNPYEFDAEATQKEIDNHLKENEDLTEEEKDYLCNLDPREGEFDYTYNAHRNNVGRYSDHEDVPMVKSLKVWLQCVFDGFEEICRRMKKEL